MNKKPKIENNNPCLKMQIPHKRENPQHGNTVKREKIHYLSIFFPGSVRIRKEKCELPNRL